MAARLKRMNRVLRARDVGADPQGSQTRADAPRQVRRTIIDFSSLRLPSDVALALAEAFWGHVGVRSANTTLARWVHVKTFSRFVVETGSLQRLTDVRSGLLARYVEWLNAQCCADGKPWSKGTRSATYTTLRTLLQWLERCRPGVLSNVEYPINPFPWRNRDTRRIRKYSAQDLKAILKACELEIAQLRALRASAEQERAAARAGDAHPSHTLGGLLECIDQRFGGIIPPKKTLMLAGNYAVSRGLQKFGGAKGVEPCLYPRVESLLPYYLAVLIYTAGNPEPIAALPCDCLQLIPLLEDREMLVWSKPRAGALQRRSFLTAGSYEPPVLVRELIAWTARLRPRVPVTHQSRLFLFKGAHGISALSALSFQKTLKRFIASHSLPQFALASIRPSVLTAAYRASGDLRKVKAIANHAHLSTTVRYVEGPEVETQNRVRIGAVQSAFLGQLQDAHSGAVTDKGVRTSDARAIGAREVTVPSGAAVTMFGFECKDPYAGIAPGARRGELCTNFMGCLTCPNAIIPSDPTTLARLLQARDHLRAAAAHLHPARWEAIYAPQLRILEEDILPRFASPELAEAQSVQSSLPPLPDLR